MAIFALHAGEMRRSFLAHKPRGQPIPNRMAWKAIRIFVLVYHLQCGKGLRVWCRSFFFMDGTMTFQAGPRPGVFG
jgi:hypothetical protein